jgi:hypothetical protein
MNVRIVTVVTVDPSPRKDHITDGVDHGDVQAARARI